VGNMPPQRKDNTPHWSRGDLVKVRSKTADDWRDAEGMIHPGGTRQTRLSLIAEEEPGAYHRSLDGADYEVRHHHESATMVDPDGMLSLLHRGLHLVLLTLGTPPQNR
jgi:hypothetical protein